MAGKEDERVQRAAAARPVAAVSPGPADLDRSVADLLDAAERLTAEARRRAPVRLAAAHPGQYLDRRFLQPQGISQTELALRLGISRRRVNELVRGHRAITPDTAIRLAGAFGNDPLLWITLQAAWDLQQAMRRLRAVR